MLIKSIRRIKLNKPVPVYDLTVDGTKNFCLSSGIVIHNSKDVTDSVVGVVFNIVNDIINRRVITGKLL